jgi:VanZ family protein
VVSGFAMSLAAETAQVFSSDRNPDSNDVIANTVGSGVGAAAVWLHRRRKPKR